MLNLADEVVLARELLRAKSPSTRESPAVAVMMEAFESLSFDRAYVDDAGNAIGLFERGEGPNVMLNGHLDTVPLGDTDLWPYPPLSGEIAEGELWGRGSVDMKSALACMAFAARDAIDRGFRGRISVTAVVQEEIGGLGARYLAEHETADVIILGEPSNLKLMLGHRGRVEVEVRFPGKIAHAAKNELGENALYRAAAFLAKLEQLQLPKGGPLGGSSVTPTQLSSFPEGGRNVVPGAAHLTIDYRNIPGDSPEEVVARLKALDPEAHYTVQNAHAVSESGKVELSYPHAIEAYLAPGENTWIQRARPVIKALLSGHEVKFHEDVWWFATDAPHLAKMGAPVIGFGPGNEELAHTTRERVPLKHLKIAREVYTALLLAFSKED